MNGERRASVDDAVAIARALGIELRTLIDGTITPDPQLDLKPIDRYELTLHRKFPRLKQQRHRRFLISTLDSLLDMERDGIDVESSD